MHSQSSETGATVRKNTPASRDWKMLAVFLVITFAAASVGAQFRPGAWYAQLAKPAWTPPSQIFAPVWTVLYVLIAVSGWLAWRNTRRPGPALQLWVAQIVLNAMWSWLFFRLNRPDLALLDILALLAAIIGFIVVARTSSRLASWLFTPYALWVAYAAALNFAIWRMN